MTRPLILCAPELSLFEFIMELLFPAEMLMRTLEQSDRKGSPVEPTPEETASLSRSSVPVRSGGGNCQLSWGVAVSGSTLTLSHCLYFGMEAQKSPGRGLGR